MSNNINVRAMIRIYSCFLLYGCKATSRKMDNNKVSITIPWGAHGQRFILGESEIHWELIT